MIMKLSKKNALSLISVFVLAACNNAANQTIAAPAQPQNASSSLKQATGTFTVYKVQPVAVARRGLTIWNSKG